MNSRLVGTAAGASGPRGNFCCRTKGLLLKGESGSVLWRDPVLPDGSRVLVTFWEAFHERRLDGTGIYRCVDELTPEGETARGFCATPRLPKN